MKLKNFMIAALGVAALALGFSSCGKDDNAAGPKISFEKSAGKAANTYDGESVYVYVQTAGEKITVKGTEVKVELTYTQKAENGQETKGTDEKFATVKLKKSPDRANTYVGQLTKGIPAGVIDAKLTFKAEDSNGKKAEATLSYKGTGKPAETKPEEIPFGWDEKTRQGGIDHLNGPGKGSFDLKSGKALSIKDSKREDRYIINDSKGDGKEFAAAWTSGTAAALANATGNGCLFIKLNGRAEFGKTPVAAIEKAMGHFAKAMSEKVEDIKEGDLILAKKGDELYLIKINQVSKTGKRAGEGFISFEYYTKK